MRFEIYNYFLKESNIKIEDIFDSYVNNTLNCTYNIDKLRLNLPSNSHDNAEQERDYKILLKLMVLLLLKIDDDLVIARFMLKNKIGKTE